MNSLATKEFYNNASLEIRKKKGQYMLELKNHILLKNY